MPLFALLSLECNDENERILLNGPLAATAAESCPLLLYSQATRKRIGRNKLICIRFFPVSFSLRFWIKMKKKVAKMQ